MHESKENMIEMQLKQRGITDKKVLDAMREVDREDFVPEDMKDRAYEDNALPIGRGQTISQPYIVAFMAQAMRLDEEDIVLEVGTGCGYNAAVLSRIAKHVYSLEIIEWLADLAKLNLQKAGIDNVSTRLGDGYKGWPEKAPFDEIALTAAAATVPEPLQNQLKVGGKIIAPVGEFNQKLVLLTKTADKEFEEKTLLPVRFVPMTGEAQHN